MESNGYPKYSTYAVQCHNGCGARNGYAASVKRWGDRKWAEADAEEEAERQALAALEAEAAEKLAAEANADGDAGKTGDLPTERMAYLMVVGNREENN
jgi:hypothetical protein